MGRITKCICDGCWKEIEKNPITIYAERVDVETGDLRIDTEDELYWTGGKDYCESCKEGCRVCEKSSKKHCKCTRSTFRSYDKK